MSHPKLVRVQVNNDAGISYRYFTIEELTLHLKGLIGDEGIELLVDTLRRRDAEGWPDE